MECVVPEISLVANGERPPLAFRHGVEYALLLLGAVQLAAFLALDEIEVYLAVVVGQLTLACVPVESGVAAKHKAPEGPEVHALERQQLVPQTQGNA